MTSAYYLRYGVWNLPEQALDDVCLSSKANLLVSPACKVIQVTNCSLSTDYDVDKLFSAIVGEYGNETLLPGNGVFKLDFSSCTVLNCRYEPVEDAKISPGNFVKLKYIPCVRKLPSGELKCDLCVFDILLLDK